MKQDRNKMKENKEYAEAENKKSICNAFEQEQADEREVEQEEASCCCGSGRRKDRSMEEKKNLIHRLNRIEGQIRGIRRMVEEDAYCVDILTQVSATSCAMNSFTKELLAEHIKGCVTEDIKEGHEDKVDELVRLIQKLLK